MACSRKLDVGPDGDRHGVALARVSPNPARSQALVRFSAEDSRTRTCTVTDLAGRLVAKLPRDRRRRGARARLDLRDAAGERVRLGLLVVLRAGSQREARAIAVLPSGRPPPAPRRCRRAHAESWLPGSLPSALRTIHAERVEWPN